MGESVGEAANRGRGVAAGRARTNLLPVLALVLRHSAAENIILRFKSTRGGWLGLFSRDEVVGRDEA